MEGFSSESTGTSTPGKTGVSDTMGCAKSAADDGATAPALPSDKTGWAGVTIAGVAVTATVATGGADGADCTATGIVERRPTEDFSPESTGTSTPGKIDCSDPVDSVTAAADVGAIATTSSMGVAGCDGATIAAAGTLGTATAVTGRTALTTSGVTMTGTLESLAVVAAATGTDATAGPTGFRHPLVSGVAVALAADFVVGISRRPVEVTDAAGVGKATAGAAPTVDLVAVGAATVRWRDCARAGATGTSCPVKSVRLMVVGQKVLGASGGRVEMDGWTSAPTVAMATGSSRAVGALASVVAGSALVEGMPLRSALAFISKSTANPSLVAKSGVVGAGVSSAGLQ